MSKHSPGPWQACTASDGRCKCGLIWSLPTDCPVATAHGPDTEGEGDTPEDQRVANMRLIAAAPEMLAMLRRLSTESFYAENGEVDKGCALCGYTDGHYKDSTCELNALLKRIDGTP